MIIKKNQTAFGCYNPLESFKALSLNTFM